MAELLSWHRPGQKVAVVDGKAEWTLAAGLPARQVMPKAGEVYTIAEVLSTEADVFLTLGELDATAAFLASWFRPVYPSAIEELRHLHAPVNDREVENV